MASWDGVASSSDGTRLAAVIAFGGIYTSTNSGVTWTATSAPIAHWHSIASSADGMKLIAAEECLMPVCDSSSAAIYTSADGGATWTNSLDSDAFSVASSADGNHLATASGAISTNSGATWAGFGGGGYEAISSSWDGTKLVSSDFNIFTSSDGGSTWSKTSAPTYLWWSVASSADGSTLLAGVVNGSASIYSSIDSGATWISNTAPTGVEWRALACSADGNKLFAAIRYGGIYTYQKTPALTITSSNSDSILSWPASATGFALQQNSHLDATNWVTVTNAPVSDEIKKQVIIPKQTAEVMFFRLAAP